MFFADLNRSFSKGLNLRELIQKAVEGFPLLVTFCISLFKDNAFISACKILPGYYLNVIY